MFWDWGLGTEMMMSCFFFLKNIVKYIKFILEKNILNIKIISFVLIINIFNHCMYINLFLFNNNP